MMKSKALLGVAVAVLLAAPAIPAQMVPDSNPGIVMSGSSSVSDLPQPALKFLNKFYKNVNVSKVEREFAKGLYDVDLADGTDIEFNNDGRVTEIEAPDGKTLAPDLLRHLMSHKAFDNLKKNGRLNSVESIDFTYNGGKLIKVETAASQPQEMVFDIYGNIVLVEVDD